MKRVEKKGFNSKREMEVLDALNEVKQLNKAKSAVNHEQLLLKTLKRFEETAETQIESEMSKFVERRKFRRISDSESGSDLMEIDDPYSIM
jgi:hypothetical protein